EQTDRVLATVRGEHEPRWLVDERPRDAFEVRNRADVLAGSGLDDVDRVVGRMGDVQQATTSIDRRVVEATLADVFGQVDVAERLQAHDVLRARDVRASPSGRRGRSAATARRRSRTT